MRKPTTAVIGLTTGVAVSLVSASLLNKSQNSNNNNHSSITVANDEGIGGNLLKAFDTVTNNGIYYRFTISI